MPAKVDPAEKRRVVPVRLSPAEQAVCSKAAEASGGVGLSTYLRDAGLGRAQELGITSAVGTLAPAADSRQLLIPTVGGAFEKPAEPAPRVSPALLNFEPAEFRGVKVRQAQGRAGTWRITADGALSLDVAPGVVEPSLVGRFDSQEKAEEAANWEDGKVGGPAPKRTASDKPAKRPKRDRLRQRDLRRLDRGKGGRPAQSRAALKAGKPPKLFATSESRWREKGQTLTSFYVGPVGSGAKSWEKITGRGATPGERKSDALRQYRERHGIK